MSLEHKIRLDWFQALRDRDRRKKIALTLLRSEILLFKKYHGVISDDNIHEIIKMMIDTRKETIALLSGKHKVHFIAKEAVEIIILNNYLPESIL